MPDKIASFADIKRRAQQQAQQERIQIELAESDPLAHYSRLLDFQYVLGVQFGVDHLEWGNADISVCYAELVDFDNDGAPELVYTCGLASEHGVGDDCYVYGYPGKLDLYYSSYSGGQATTRSASGC